MFFKKIEVFYLLLWRIAAPTAAHNGVVHLPGESSSLLVGPAILDDKSRSVVAVINYGRNYIRAVDSNGDVVHEAQTNPDHFPMSAVMYSNSKYQMVSTFAVSDVGDSIQFTYNGRIFNAPGCGPPSEGKFYQYADDSMPLKYFSLVTGKVYDVDISDSEPLCKPNATLSWNSGIAWSPSWKSNSSQQSPMFYAHAYFQGCSYFVHPDSRGAVIIDSPDCGMVSDMVNDACKGLSRSFQNTLHEGADLFLYAGNLYACNGETSTSCEPGNPAASQNDMKYAGKVLRIDPRRGMKISLQVVAAGLRHPFAAALMTAGPKKGAVAIAETGDAIYDEVNFFDGDAGVNYGWPIIEGFVLRQSHPRHTSKLFTNLRYPYYYEHRKSMRHLTVSAILGSIVGLALLCSFVLGKRRRQKQPVDWGSTVVLLATLLIFSMPAWLWIASINAYTWPLNPVVSVSGNPKYLTEAEIALSVSYAGLFIIFTAAAAFSLAGNSIGHTWLASGVAVFVGYAAAYAGTASPFVHPSFFLVSGFALSGAACIWIAALVRASNRGPKHVLLQNEGGMQF